VRGSERRISGAGVPQGPEASAMAGSPGLPSLAPKGVALYDTDRVWTLPNVLSFLRLAGVPLVLWLILGPEADGLAVLVLALGGLTDWLDGYLARAWHQTSRIGQMLDPIADRLYILAVLIGLTLREIVPWWLAVIIVGRDVFVVVLVPILKTRGYSSLPVHFVGKVATFCLLYAFPLVLLGSGQQGWLQLAWVLGWAFAIWGTALYWYAGGIYAVQIIRFLRSTPPLHDRSRPSVTR
jgi:cardiolipin synthase